MLTVKTQATLPPADGSMSVRYLKGVGPEKERLLAQLGIRTLRDLFYWFPRRHEARFPVKKSSELAFEGKECVGGTVSSRALLRFGGRAVFKAVIAGDGGPPLYAIFYNQPYLLQIFKPKSHVVLYGTAEKKGKRIEMLHPEYEVFQEPPVKSAHHGRWTPVYSLTEELTQKSLRQMIYNALAGHGNAVPETLPAVLLNRHKLIGLRHALRHIHFPDDLRTYGAAYRRLVFEEFLTLQLAIERRRAKLRRERPEIAHAGGWADVENFLASMPFELTAGQRSAVREIVADMGGTRVMNRLVQGDVGSGKTAVAAAALYYTARNGFQGALMAPTEVLAQQLYLHLTQSLEPFGIGVGYLGQSAELSQRDAVCRALESGELPLVVGTHALLEPKVRFKKLGLAVVDEQHKFGVEQRAALRQKGGKPCHALAMTATPIPRTLAMTLYGDMDLSVIAEKPAGRLPVKTLCFREAERPAVYRWLEGVLAEGAQAFVICPWVDSEKETGVKKAQKVHHELLMRFPKTRIALLHGRMKSAEKSAVMRDFAAGKTQVLVSTVLVEVGVDVPRARFMLIENAEKFGLAQLHQLRGRIGRGPSAGSGQGAGESFCVLFSDSENPETVERLEVFTATGSGFEIAERDLAQRGAGETAGRKQHGFLKLRIGDLIKDGGLLKLAKEEARAIAEKRP